MKLKQFGTLMALLSAVSFAHGATVATDVASNAAYGDGWTTGDNGGSGFTSWTLSSTGGGGSYVGSTGQGNPSFGLYGTSSGSSTASRGFTGGALTLGQTFSIDLGHTSTITDGNDIGILLTDGGSTVFTLKFVGGDSEWKLNDGGALDFGAGQDYAANSSITFSFTYEGGNDYSYTFGTGSGSNYTATNTISGIDGFTLFNNNQGDDQNLGANNISIVPEPASAALGLLGSVLLLRRRRI